MRVEVRWEVVSGTERRRTNYDAVLNPDGAARFINHSNCFIYEKIFNREDLFDEIQPGRDSAPGLNQHCETYRGVHFT
jgi:hypothetical protein